MINNGVIFFFSSFYLRSSSRIKKEDVDTEGESIFLNVDKTHHKIVLKDILYIESNRNYITVVTVNGKLSYIESLKNWANRLPEEQFIQTHKSFIINKRFVEKISGNEIYISESRIPIGRTYKQELLKRLKIG